MARRFGAKDLKQRKNRTSKYVGKTYEGWTVVHIGVATVQGAGAKWAYHRGYYYLLERPTSDGKFVKQVRLNANYMAQLARGQLNIEAIADKRAHNTKSATRKTTYTFN